MSKLSYFKKNWPDHLQSEVLACAERIVCHILFIVLIGSNKCESLKLTITKWENLQRHHRRTLRKGKRVVSRNSFVRLKVPTQTKTSGIQRQQLPRIQPNHGGLTL